MFGPRAEQPAGEVVVLRNWELDDEFPYGPQGAKPKRVLISPEPVQAPYLLGSHRYLFKEPSGGWAQQIWAEIIAYEWGRRLGIDVPPAFAAIDPHLGSPGVLVEFFYGYVWEVAEKEVRFVQGADALQRNVGLIDYDRGSLRDNVRVCRMQGVVGWGEWWAKTLVFDALIGNTDRHSENWGFLATWEGGAPQPGYSMAPAFDNGTSLGFRVRDAELQEHMRAERARTFVRRGKHHYGWFGGDHAAAGHGDLCATFASRYPAARAIMVDTAERLTDAVIDEVLERCTRFDFPVAFTAQRGDFVRLTTRMRRATLLESLRGVG